MLPALEAECVKESQARGTALPSDWSIRGLLKELRKEMMNVRHAVLKTSASLRRSGRKRKMHAAVYNSTILLLVVFIRLWSAGVLTAVLANHWLDDCADEDSSARLLCLLGGHFDLVLQSCHLGHRVPEPTMFSTGLQQLGVTPKNVQHKKMFGFLHFCIL